MKSILYDHYGTYYLLSFCIIAFVIILF